MEIQSQSPQSSPATSAPAQGGPERRESKPDQPGKSAKEMATDAAHSVKEQGLALDQLKEKIGHVAHDAADAARTSAADEGLQPSQLKEKAGNVLSEAKTAAEEETKKKEPSDPNSPPTG